MAIVGQAAEAQPEEADAPRLHAAPWMRLPAAAVRRVFNCVLHIGVREGLPVNAIKRLRLCNVVALGGAFIMGAWAAVEGAAGTRESVGWELGFAAAFLAVLALSAAGAHRLARLLLLVTANVCVFAGALLFTEPSGGAAALLRDGRPPAAAVSARANGCRSTLGAALPALLLVACKTGLAAALFSVHPRRRRPGTSRPTPSRRSSSPFWSPSSSSASNLKAEASLQRIGQEKLKRVIDADLIGVVRGRLSGRIEDANGTFLCLLGYTRAAISPPGALDLEDDRARSGLVRGRARRSWAPPRSTSGSAGARTARPSRRWSASRGSTAPARRRPGVRRRDDEVVGFVLDLTAQKHVEAQQRACCADSREALRLRDLFNSIASHELKTPLTALLLNLRLLRGRLEQGGAGRRHPAPQVKRCETAAARMGELIHTLLDVAQIHDGKLTLTVRETDVVEAVRNVVSGFEERRGGRQRAASPSQAEGPVTARARFVALRSGRRPTCSRTPSSTAPASRSRCASATTAPPTSPTWR